MRLRAVFWALLVSLALWACESEMVEKENNLDPDDIENPDNETEIDTFYVVIDTVFSNIKCISSEQNFGEFKAHIFNKDGIEIGDYSVYEFQWYTGLDLSTPLAAEDSSRIMNLTEGNYTLVVTDTIGRTVQFSATITDEFIGFPKIRVDVLSDHTVADPPNGSLMVVVEGGNYRYTFQWADSGSPLEGQTSAIATGLAAGTYTATITTPAGCSAVIDGVILDLTP